MVRQLLPSFCNLTQLVFIIQKIDFLHNESNAAVIIKLLDYGVQPQPVQIKRELPLKFKTIAFTGDLEHFTRSEAREKSQSLGARVVSSVSRTTDYIVVGKEPGQKLEQARSFKITQLNENDFLKLTGEL